MNLFKYIYQAVKNTSFFLGGIVLSLAILSCNKKNKIFYFPNGKIFNIYNIFDFEKENLNLSFIPYKGFTGYLNDTLFSTFVVYTYDDGLMKTDKVTTNDIKRFKSKEVEKIVFDKIASDRISIENLVNYLKGVYPDCIAKEITETDKYVDNKVMLFSQKNNYIYCYIEVINFGIPGFMVTLVPN